MDQNIRLYLRCPPYLTGIERSPAAPNLPWASSVRILVYAGLGSLNELVGHSKCQVHVKSSETLRSEDRQSDLANYQHGQGE